MIKYNYILGVDKLKDFLPVTDKWWDGIEVWACGKDKWLIECETTVLGAVPEVAEDVWWCKCGGELGSLLMRTEFGDGEEGGDEFGTPRWDIPLQQKNIA